MEMVSIAIHRNRKGVKSVPDNIFFEPTSVATATAAWLDGLVEKHCKAKDTPGSTPECQGVQEALLKEVGRKRKNEEMLLRYLVVNCGVDIRHVIQPLKGGYWALQLARWQSKERQRARQAVLVTA